MSYAAVIVFIHLKTSCSHLTLLSVRLMDCIRHPNGCLLCYAAEFEHVWFNNSIIHCLQRIISFFNQICQSSMAIKTDIWPKASARDTLRRELYMQAGGIILTALGPDCSNNTLKGQRQTLNACDARHSQSKLIRILTPQSRLHMAKLNCQLLT